MKRDNRQLAKGRSSTQDEIIVSEAALLEWIRPRSRELTFTQLIDQIAQDTLPDPTPARPPWTAIEPVGIGSIVHAQTNESHLTQTERG